MIISFLHIKNLKIILIILLLNIHKEFPPVKKKKKKLKSILIENFKIVYLL
jgi:hypothetical protein